MKTAWIGLSLSTKISLIFTGLMLLAIPATVLSVNMIQDHRTRAASLGDPNYPDPVVSFSTKPHWSVQICNSGATKNDMSNCQISETNGFGDSGSETSGPAQTGSLLQAPGKNYDIYIDVLVKDSESIYAGVAYILYTKGSFVGSCSGGAAYCSKTISWSTPNLTVDGKKKKKKKNKFK